jgi:ComF family protein
LPQSNPPRAAPAAARLILSLRAVAHRLLEGAFPADCHLCGGWLPWRQRGGACPSCWDTLPWSPGVRLPGRGALAALLWAGEYGGGLRRLIHVLKFEGFDACGPPLGAAAAERLWPLILDLAARGRLPEPDLVIPVPLHWTRRWRRGFNQSQLLAEGLAQVAGLPAAPELLARVRRGRRQLGLKRRERLVALAGVFRARPRAGARRRTLRLRGRVVILVDDVATTGATLEACAAALRAAGARAVIGCVVARTP